MHKERSNDVYVIMGGQFGDEGKGLISAYVARRDNAGFVVKAGVGPNAEHGLFVTEEGPYIKVNQLPLGWILNPSTQIRIGRNVAIDPDKLLSEIGKYHLEERVKIDCLSPIITQEHIRSETVSKHFSENIGSTCSGSGFCRADHVLRTAKLARDIDELHPFLTDVTEEVNKSASTETIIIESSQGYGLSLGSEYYPNTTSKDITSSQALADVGLNPFHLTEVVLCIKTMPTREGGGSLGTRELSLTEIQDNGLTEISSIGGKIRRKGESIDFEMLQKASLENGATQIALTFCEHYDPAINNVVFKSKLTKRMWQLIDQVQKTTNVPVTILNTGKRFDSILDLTDKKIPQAKLSEDADFSAITSQ